MLTAAVASEGGDALGELGLAVGGLVLVDDALGDGLVQLAGGGLEVLERGVLVSGLDGLAHAAHVGLELGLDGLVAQAGLLVGLDALDLGLDVRHGETFSRLIGRWPERGFAPRVDMRWWGTWLTRSPDPAAGQARGPRGDSISPNSQWLRAHGGCARELARLC